MAVMYELVDTHTGNWLGVHPTQEAALAAVVEMLRLYGEGAVANVALGRFDDATGQGELIAEGHPLAEMARTPA
jgi:hypothetical protein